MAKVAKDYRGRITFAVSNEEEFEEDLKQLNLDDSGEDVNVGYFESEKIRYRMEPVEDFSAEELRNFVEDVLEGNCFYMNMLSIIKYVITNLLLKSSCI